VTAGMIAYFTESAATLARCDQAFSDMLDRIVDVLEVAFRAGNKVLICGNGGSAADAQHLAGELVTRLNFDRPGLPAIALTTDTSVLTGAGNDYDFARIFSRQVAALGQRGDVLIAFSTSGRSPNVLRALEQARLTAMVTVGLTGARDDEEMSPSCDFLLRAPSTNTQLIQQVHQAAYHALVGEVERRIFT
jgi:D-sedoheptulose 7-phosphate isomerase